MSTIDRDIELIKIKLGINPNELSFEEEIDKELLNQSYYKEQTNKEYQEIEEYENLETLQSEEEYEIIDERVKIYFDQSDSKKLEVLN
ncbi:hypothetical protein SGLAD_v1c03160 [Spiroplasma gladiatoris]|uniref:Uncharacterized protein n=1 Tax=Spiroplasma gladiatoris TaxID=2143 RepID=A0A4P7AGJ8_9MOLU|nr:hypothetical protein [Spiroplasma gladiatoris]QBQ07515.1 hypothetical protein SGLAD_v1c03160 [Spiroplasma gladiatoris]